MTYDELATRMAEVSVDTTDPLTSKFKELFKNLPDEKLVLREIIYLKAFYCSFAVVSNSNDTNREEALQTGNLMLKKLEDYFNQNDCGCNANYIELKTAHDFYWNKFQEHVYAKIPPGYGASFIFDKRELFNAITFTEDNFFRFLEKKYW